MESIGGVETVLILGGSSSIGEELIKVLAVENIRTIATRRDLSMASHAVPVNRSWLQLDLSSWKSCEEFISLVKGEKFTRVVLCIGQLAATNGRNLTTVSDFATYIEAFVSNYCWVVSQLIERGPSAPQILHVSSRSAKYGSGDALYALAKASMEIFLRSKSKLAPDKVKTLSVRFGLTEDSGMSKYFTQTEMEDHRNRAGGLLLSVEEVAQKICSLLLDGSDSSGLVWDGRAVAIGADYA